jgi:hypothetical protein
LSIDILIAAYVGVTDIGETFGSWRYPGTG